MTADSSSSPRTAPGSHNPDFSPENPAVSWAKENKGFLITLLVALTIGSSFNYYWPRYQRDNLSSSWALFQELSADPANFSAEKVDETLARARTDERTYPWVIHSGVSAALSSNDKVALGKLKQELDTLATDTDLAGYRMVGAEGPEPLFQFTLGMVERALSPEAERSFTNPAPTGKTVKFTLTVNEVDTYEFTAGLYSEASPAACAWFEEAVASGKLLNAGGLRQGSFGFKFAGEAPEEGADPIELERKWGYFHLPGALYLTQTPGAPNEMDPAGFELGLMDAGHLDGVTTVFGMLTSGAEHLDLLQFGGPSAPDQVDSIYITAIEIVG